MDTKAQPHGPHPRMVILLDRIKDSTTQIARDQEELTRLLGQPIPGRSSMDLNRLVDPVPCILVAGILGKRSDNIQRTMQRNGFAVAKARGRWYCQAEDAAKLWPRFQHYRQKNLES